MPRLVHNHIVGFLFAICFAVQGAAGQATLSAADAIRFQRANLVVADIEKAARVYRDVLGLTLTAVRDLPPGGYAYEIFQVPAEAALRFAVFSSDSQSNIVALTEVKNVLVPKRETGLLRTGLVLETADFDGVITRANALGLRVFSENELIASGGRFGRQQGFVDYDGNVIVVYAFNNTAEKE